MKNSSPPPLPGNSGNRLFVFIILGTAVFCAVILGLAITQSTQDRFWTIPERSDIHLEQKNVYRENKRAMEDYNRRPLTAAEKSELWYLSRSDAEANVAEKKADAASEQPEARDP